MIDEPVESPQRHDLKALDHTLNLAMPWANTTQKAYKWVMARYNL